MRIKIMLMFVILSVGISYAGERSKEWHKVREEYLREHPFCAVCGISKDLQVHHIKPYHLFPLLELDKDNLITLCTSKYWGINCHLIAGHSGVFKWYNRWVLEDVGILKVYANPDYIKEFGREDLDNYIKYMKVRTKKFNMDMRKEEMLINSGVVQR